MVRLARFERATHGLEVPNNIFIALFNNLLKPLFFEVYHSNLKACNINYYDICKVFFKNKHQINTK